MIQAEATTPIPTGVVFWSHDKGTAKLITQLKKGHINQTLSQGTIVPILLEFNSVTAANGRGRHIYHAVIEDALEGIVSIVLEDNILGYVGRVDGSVYIELPDSRSLDTAGRFTFDIKRSPIDEDVPELEDYYWQGFGEIMEQYHESIAEIKSEAKALLDSLTADVTTVQNELTNLNTRIDEINQKIDDNDVFTKAETSANVVYQLIGKDKARVTFDIDFKDKVAGSVIENPNYAKRTHGGMTAVTTLLRPEEFPAEFSDEWYQTIDSQDKIYRALTAENVDGISQQLFAFDLVAEFKRKLGENFFINLGVTELLAQVRLIRKIIRATNSTVWGFGVGKNGNRLYQKIFNQNNSSWQYSNSNTASTVQPLNIPIPEDNAQEHVMDNGFLYMLVYTDPSDGTKYSTLNTDYVRLEINIELSANELIMSMIAANHRENLATQEEAETGENNSKPMTPLRVSQAISKWVANKFISLAGNDTISGTKDFVGNLLVNKKRVLTVDDLPSDSVNLSVVNGNSGNARLYWQGKSVTIYFTVLNGKSGGGNDSTILTIPEGYRPPTGFEKLIGSVDRSALNSAQISIGADGVVRWRRNSNYASDYTFEVTFVRA